MLKLPQFPSGHTCALSETTYRSWILFHTSFTFNLIFHKGFVMNYINWLLVDVKMPGRKGQVIHLHKHFSFAPVARFVCVCVCIVMSIDHGRSSFKCWCLFSIYSFVSKKLMYSIIQCDQIHHIQRI